ncbi:MAG: hypothetical protein JWO09_1529 [Bacteroidetes bacterium]|nr:hypothetical protein [Bacteroidota bacterium]
MTLFFFIVSAVFKRFFTPLRFVQNDNKTLVMNA